MTTRKRIRTTFSQASGGGGAPPTVGNVAWGPDFGDQAGNDNISHHCGVNVDISALALGHTRTVGVNVDISALAANFPTIFNDGVHLSGSVLGAPFWQSVGTSTATASPIVGSMPAGFVAGDLLLAFVGGTATAGAPTFATPAGWTASVSNSVTGAANGTSAYCFWRIATGGDAAPSFTIGGTTTAVRATCEIHRLNGTDGTTPINATNSGTLLGTALTPDPVNVSVTTTVANCLVFAYLQHDHLALNQTHTAPASHVEATDFEATNTGNISSSTTDWRVFASAAATGTATHNCTETVATDAVYLRVAIAPGSLVIAS